MNRPWVALDLRSRAMNRPWVALDLRRHCDVRIKVVLKRMLLLTITGVSTIWVEIMFGVMWIVNQQSGLMVLMSGCCCQFYHDIVGCWDSRRWLVRFDTCVVIVIFVGLLLVKYVSGFSIFFICCVDFVVIVNYYMGDHMKCFLLSINRKYL